MSPVCRTRWSAPSSRRSRRSSRSSSARRARRRVLVIGAGVAGAEAARMAAAAGHAVEIWERADRPGGQIDLAVAGPDKAEVEGVWRYRREALERLGVPLRTGVEADAAAIRAFAP